jgi:hypothetical protein
MFRKMLFVTTALVVIHIFPSSAQPMERLLGGDTRVESLSYHRINHKVDSLRGNANEKFLCDYGYSVTSSEYYSNDGSSNSRFASSWVHIAIPIVGKGKVVDTILVANGPKIRDTKSGFDVGVYSNTPSGIPGNEIVGGGVKGRPGCLLRRIHIPETLLNAGTTYWLMESSPVEWQHRYTTVWNERESGTTTIMKQAHGKGWGKGYNYSSTTGWEPTYSAPAPFAVVR